MTAHIEIIKQVREIYAPHEQMVIDALTYGIGIITTTLEDATARITIFPNAAETIEHLLGIIKQMHEAAAPFAEESSADGGGTVYEVALRQTLELSAPYVELAGER